MYCLLKLNGQTKWNALIANSAKTAFVNEDEGGDPTVPRQDGLALAKKVIRNQGRKWEEGKKKVEGAAAKMTKKFKDIMTKEEASVARNEVKEGNKGERFGIFMEMQDKKLKLQEKKLEVKAASKDSKMFFVKTSELAQQCHAAMLKRLVQTGSKKEVFRTDSRTRSRRLRSTTRTENFWDPLDVELC